MDEVIAIHGAKDGCLPSFTFRGSPLLVFLFLHGSGTVSGDADCGQRSMPVVSGLVVLYIFKTQNAMKEKEKENYSIPVQELITEELVNALSVTKQAFLNFGEESGRAIVDKVDTLLVDEPAFLPYVSTFHTYVLHLSNTDLLPRKKANQEGQAWEELVTLLNATSLGCHLAWEKGHRIADKMMEIMDDDLLTFFYELANTIKVRQMARRSAIS